MAESDAMGADPERNRRARRRNHSVHDPGAVSLTRDSIEPAPSADTDIRCLPGYAGNQAGCFTLGRSYIRSFQASRAVHSGGTSMLAKPANSSPPSTVVSAIEKVSPAT